MSPRQILYGRKFKNPLCKIGELVLAYDTLVSNDTGQPRAFFALYIEPNDNGTRHSVIKLQAKRLVTTPKCIPKPMTQDVVDIVNQLGEQEGSPNGIQFMNVDGRATLEDLYPDEEHEDYSCVSNMDYKTESDEDEELSVDDLIGDELQLLKEEYNQHEDFPDGNDHDDDDEIENNEEYDDIQDLEEENENTEDDLSANENMEQNDVENNNAHLIPKDEGFTTIEDDYNEVSFETASSWLSRNTSGNNTSQDISYETTTDERNQV